MTRNLAQKPESGGMPASDIAGTRNRIASHGADFISPPVCRRSNEPPAREMAPASRNRFAFTMMWCTT